MLSNYLWGNWGSENGESRTVIGSDGKLQVVIRDEELKDLEGNVKDPDELADRLMTQFPAYGTNSLVSSGQSEDWLLSKDDEDGISASNTKNANIGSSSGAMYPQLGESRLEHSAAGIPPNTVTDWDYDEQYLWKSGSAAENEFVIDKQGNKGNDNNQSDPLLRHPSQQQQHNPRHQQQWIYGKNINEPSRNEKDALAEDSSANGSQPYKRHGDNAMQDFYNDRQHWMPDQLCKHCYACDAPFTVFRRRHHCRLCGQVFCAACAGYFVPSRRSTATLRTCQMCHEQVTQKGGLVHMDAVDVGNNGGNAGGDSHHAAGEAGIERSDDENEPSPGPNQSHPMMPHLSLLQQAVIGKSALPEQPTSLDPSNTRERQQQQSADIQPNASKKADSANLADHMLDAAEAKRHLGLTAASHLFKIGEELLAKEAPLLWEELRKSTGVGDQMERQTRGKWTHKLMTLATRCCATVEPNVKNGDLLDIRPYCKLKVIPAGSYKDSAYLSGILFRKAVSHKRMAKEIKNPKIMLLSGGIEFTRTENRIASLHTLLEQEGKYMEILVGRILKLKPDILLVGRSVSRRAQELLLKANVVLIQHVKSTLMSRISRQTGATVISSTDHIMNQFGIHVLGQCNRFRLVTFRDNDVWADKGDVFDSSTANELSARKSVEALLKNPEISNHERQAALAANMLGEHPLDGSESVKSGLLKRGVGVSFVMLEGCPKHLGCTIVLRGASRPALKQVKRVFRFLVSVAYNLRLETSYLKERCARIRQDFQVEPRHICSSSLCVDYGSPPNGRKVYPWNGGNNEALQRSVSGEITAFHHQSILLTSVWMADKTQCCPAEVKGICYYSLQDVSLGQFLRDSCFNLSLKCQNPACKKSVIDHSLSFVHKDGLIKITVEQMDGPLPPAPGRGNADEKTEEDDEPEDTDSPIATWTYCKHCAKVVTPLVYISENSWKFSFGKFLEVFFYNRDAVMNSTETSCRCNLQIGTILYFGCGRLAASFNYERVRPLGVFVRRNLPIDESFHKREALQQLERISMASSSLFIRFDKHIDRVSREARSLFGSAANRPEHLQTVLSELNRIGSEVDHAAMTLQEKIASVSDKCRRGGDGLVNEALYRFPWFSRRYLFMLTSAWNERLSAAGQAIVAMRKLASSAALRGDSVIGPNGPITGTEELNDAMKRLRQLNEVYSRYNVTDITTVLPTIHGNNQQDPEYDDDFEDVDVSIDFADGVDADVLASRRRLNNTKSMALSNQTSRAQLHKSLGTQRSFDSSQLQQESAQSQPRVTPGGAVKSAITRFFNRGGRDVNPYIVDLGIFNEGRPRLEPGVNGHVVPVVDEQMSTVIAYSLSSTEYAKQFKSFSRMESTGPEMDEANPTPDPSSAAQLPSPSSQNASKSAGGSDEKKTIEQRMLVRNKSHIKHTFRDYDEKGLVTCKFVCQHYWATQFQAVRQAFLSPNAFNKKDASSTASDQSEMDIEPGYVQSLSSAFSWATSGGKSGASFARTVDDRFVIKCISRTELQMFLDCAPAYFEYLSKAFFHGLPTVLCKIVGVYQIGYHNRETGKRSMEQVAVMQNIFYSRKISKVFDLKGSLKGRFAAQVQSSKEDSKPETPTFATDISGSGGRGLSAKYNRDADPSRGHKDSVTSVSDKETNEDSKSSSSKSSGTQLDGDFLEFTSGRPMPLNDRAKSLFHMSIQNDTLFLSIINVLDYSILIGIDEEKMELVVGIIDFMRQYDILKQMERVGKSLPMVVGSEAPTIIQPPLYKARFTNAMERYFMTVPCKWTAI